jgi:aryl-alcohol dehydrogenase-like predicted oxidoreductase
MPRLWKAKTEGSTDHRVDQCSSIQPQKDIQLTKRSLGKSGLQVSEVGLGCNALGGRIDREASRKVVHAALDLGITLFDTSDLYGGAYGTASGSEICLGQLLGDRRKDIVLATKFGNPRMPYNGGMLGGASRRIIMEAVEGSLKRLKTDWIDLYQLHRPDPLTRSRRPCGRSTTSPGRARSVTQVARTSRHGRQ